MRLLRRTVLAGLVAAPLAPSAALGHGRLLFSDSFKDGLGRWRLEAEKPAQVVAETGVLDVLAPAGLTLWFRQELKGPVVIRYEAQAVSEGGPLDRVSDLNAFWMAREASGASVHAKPRSGAFADYDTLRTYYVGQGGNGNTTTRFRRYVGRAGERPLLPQHDLASADTMLVANRWTEVTLVADGPRIAYWSDGRRLIEHHDPEPYTRGWFALRTTQSHLRLRNFEIRRP